MPLSAALEADFSEFTAECGKAVEALAAMTAQAESATAALSQMSEPKAGEEVASGAEKASTAVKGANDASKQFLGTLKDIAGAVGVSFTIGGIVAFTKATFAAADAVNTTAERTGLTIEQVQRLDYVARQSGGSIDNVTGALDTLSRKMETVEGQHAIEELGIDFRALRSASPYDLLQEVGSALESLPNPSRRAALELELLGRTGAKIAPALGAQFGKLADDATVSSDAQVKASAAAAQAATNAQATITAAAVEAAGSILIAGKKIVDDPSSLWNLVKRMGELGGAGGLLKWAQDVATAGEIATGGAAKLSGAPSRGALIDAGVTPEERAEGERKVAEAKREAEAATKAQAEAEAELSIVRQGADKILASMTDSQIAAIKADIEGGASQATLVAAYGKTGAEARVYAAQVDAVVTAHEREKAAVKEISDTLDDFYADRAARSATTTQREIDAIELWRDKALAALAETKGATEDMYSEVHRAASEALTDVGIDWDVLREGAKKSIEDQYVRAQVTYTAMKAEAEKYTTAALENAKKVSEEYKHAFDLAEAEGNAMYKAWLEGEKQYLDAIKAHDKARSESAGAAADAASSAQDKAIAYAQAYGVTLAAAQEALGQTGAKGKAAFDGIAAATDRATASTNALAGAYQFAAQTSEQYFDLAAGARADSNANYMNAGGGGAFVTAAQYGAMQAAQAADFERRGNTLKAYEDSIANARSNRSNPWGTGQGATTTTNTLNLNVNNQDAKQLADRLVSEMANQGVRF